MLPLPANKGTWRHFKARAVLSFRAAVHTSLPSGSLRQPYTSPSPILRNDLDAGLFEGPLNRVSDVLRHGRAFAVLPLKALDRRE
jgi:hypothetical protein